MAIAIMEETLSYLRLNCIWPPKDKELNPSKFHYVKFFLMILSTSIILFGSSYHLVVSVKNGSSNISEDLVLLIAEVGVYYFMTSFEYYLKDIAQIMTDLSDFENYEKPYHFDKSSKRLKFFSKVYKTYIDIAIVIFCGSPLLITTKICEKENQYRDFKEACGFVVTTWMPFEFQGFPMKQLLVLWQCYTILFTFKGASVVSFTIMETMEHLVIKIQHLEVMILNCVNNEFDNEVLREKRFYSCIKHHNYILDIGKRIDVCYQGCLFLHALLTGALFGCIGFQLKTAFPLNSVSLLIGWMVTLLVVCIGGQNLIDESLTVSDTVYNSKWYERNVNLKKSLILIMMRSQKPIIVHAGPFSYVSHVLLLTICKTAYSYMTLLNATSNQ